MFDTVRVKCLKCNNLIEFQSKAGDCHLLTYGPDKVPVEIAVDLNDRQELCPSCRTMMVCKTDSPVYAKVWVEAIPNA
jgi:hypothetical protein